MDAEIGAAPAVLPAVALVSSAPRSLRVIELAHGVRVELLAKGDGKTFPEKSVEANLVGRLLPSGCVFECTEAKGQPPMKLALGQGAILPGMELGLKALSLGAKAELRIPARLGYAGKGVPHLIPPDSDLLFWVHVLVVDGVPCAAAAPAEGATQTGTSAGRLEEVEDCSKLKHPWWMSRVQRPPPSSYYLNYCRYMRGGLPAHLLAEARPIPRKSRLEATGWDPTAGGVHIVAGVQDDWRARQEWDLEWFKTKLGTCRQMAKWQGPVFTKQESLWDSPVWEMSVADFVDFAQAVDRVDPENLEGNAPSCPRLYLNGWPAFKQLPWLREHIVNPTFFDDVSGDLIADSEELRECFLQGVSRGYQPPPEEERQRLIDDEYWDLTKLFLSPKGAFTRLHFDNGGAHGWLSQVRGRKLFVCFEPGDGEHLHPFEGDEGLLNGSWTDPLDADAHAKWPSFAKARPLTAIVEEGETIVIPQGWWHFAVALDPSVTVMRNFYSKGNRHEMIRRKDDVLEAAVVSHVLRAKFKNQPDEVLRGIAKKTVAKLRGSLDARAVPSSRRPSPGGVSNEKSQGVKESGS